MLAVLVKPAFQKQCGSQRIHRALAVAATLALVQALALGLECGEALVVSVHGQVEATLQPAGESERALAHFAGRSVHVQWQADDDRIGLPLADQSGDLVPVRHAVLRLQDTEFARLAGDGLADGYADLFGTVVEAE